MASGYGVNVNDWVVLAGVGIAAYFAYTLIIKPGSKVTSAISDDLTAIAYFPNKVVTWLNPITTQQEFSNLSTSNSWFTNLNNWISDVETDFGRLF
jgi:hypothetical protein